MKVPRVFMIGWEFPPYNSGGLGTACAGLTKALSFYHVNQVFVLPRQLPFTAAWAEFACPFTPNLTFLHVNMKLLPYGPIEKRNSFLDFDDNFHNGNMVDQAKEYAGWVKYLSRRYQSDLIHAHDWMTYPAAIAAKAETGKPIIAHIHSTEFDRTLNGNTNQAIADIEYEGLTKADRIIAVSQYTKNLICDKYLIDPSKVSVVHNGVDLDAQKHIQISPDDIEAYARNKKVVIFVGRITCQKGPDYFINIATKVLNSCPDTLFVMAGNGDLYQNIIMQSAQSKLTGKLLFAGFLREREREFLYRRADLFIMPSVSEPFGIVALEAAGAYTPIIISKQSGVSEVMENAIKCNFWDVDEISYRAVQILKSPELKWDLAYRCAMEAQNITWDKAAQKCLAVYREFI